MQQSMAERRAWTVALLALGGSHITWAQSTPAPTPARLGEVTVVATSPVGGTAIPADKFPGNVQVIRADALSAEGADLAQRLNQVAGSVNVNDTQGSPYQVDLNYRGFTASPALGTPQGLSVFVDGVRWNEPFGDVVSWDLVPLIALDSVTVIPGSNPVYGLNTLGGAIALTTKDGTKLQGMQVSLRAGSFGRIGMDLERGSSDDNGSLYLAASLHNDGGWASYNPGQIRQLFGKFGWRSQNADLALSLAYADNLMYGNQQVPLSMLDNASQGYSHPDYVGARSYLLNLQGNVDLDVSNALSGNVYLRNITRDILNSNIGAVIADAPADASCALADPVTCPASNLLAHYTQQVLGANLQWNNTDAWLGLNQVFTLGVNAEQARTDFSNHGQYAVVDASSAVLGVAPWLLQSDVSSTGQRLGVFASSTFDASDALSVTLSARYDYASVNLAGTSCTADGLCDLGAGLGASTDVSGAHSYQRLNPSVGLSYQLAPHVSAFASYAEGMRVPSAIELACADPQTPCSGIPNAFGADPELQAVVSHSYEFGLRGNLAGLAKWRVALYQTTLDNDILFNQSSFNSGYFSNVGQTRRQGLELGMDGRHQRFDYAIDLDWIDATYQSSFALANASNSAPGQNAVPGNRIPGIPQWVLKAGIGYQPDGVNRIHLALQAQDGVYARGDENNADVNGKIPGYAVWKLDYQHALDRHSHLFAGIDNLFDARYAGFGSLAANNLATGANEQFRSVGAPRTLHIGWKAAF